MGSDMKRRSQSSAVYLWLLFAVNAVAIRIAIARYGEPFLFWDYPFSSLGATETMNGHPNMDSLLIYAGGSVISAAVLFVHGAVCLRGRGPYDRRVIGWASLIAALGYLVATTPYNLEGLHPPHSVGSALVFFGLWLTTNRYLFYLKSTGRPGLFWLGQLVLETTIFAYAVGWFGGHPAMQALQKLSLFGMAGTLLVAATVFEYAAVRRQSVTEGESGRERGVSRGELGP